MLNAEVEAGAAESTHLEDARHGVKKPGTPFCNGSTFLTYVLGTSDAELGHVLVLLTYMIVST